jgi:hypothetical protein
MTRLVSLKAAAAALVVFGTFGAATSAQAGGAEQFGFNQQAHGHSVPTRPVYVQPPAVPVPSHNGYPHGHMQPAPVYVRPAPVYVQPRGGHEWGNRWGYGHHAHARGPWGDYDRDGVPNRYDRFPGNPYRR